MMHIQRVSSKRETLDLEKIVPFPQTCVDFVPSGCATLDKLELPFRVSHFCCCIISL